MESLRCKSQSNDAMDFDGADAARLDLDVARSLFNWSGLCLASLDSAQRLMKVNNDFLRHFGGCRPEPQNRSFYDFLHDSSQEKVRRQFGKLAVPGQSHFTERIMGVGPSSSVFSGLLRAVAVRGDSDLMSAAVVIVRPDGVVAADAPRCRDKALNDIDALILEGVAAGASTIQLASRLHLSRQGIEYRVALMLRRFKVPNRPALVSRAYAMGAFGAGSWPPRVLSNFRLMPAGCRPDHNMKADRA